MNRGPLDLQSNALPTELSRHYWFKTFFIMNEVNFKTLSHLHVYEISIFYDKSKNEFVTLYRSFLQLTKAHQQICT